MARDDTVDAPNTFTVDEKPSLSLESVMPHESVTFHGSFVVLSGEHLGYCTAKVRRRRPNGEWITENSKSFRAEQGRFGRCTFEVVLEAPVGAWTPGTHQASVWHGGKRVADATMIVQESATQAVE
jgi:hypothetical protein